ncbi:Uncharacterised protein [Mycobacteroides abscessus subsp. abscessus]|nr:Uncharacterised protein [Mycobacteroides abscessus subsp. abscessus]
MSAAQVLDAIALKYPDAVLLCEMVIADPARRLSVVNYTMWAHNAC